MSDNQQKFSLQDAASAAADNQVLPKIILDTNVLQIAVASMTGIEMDNLENLFANHGITSQGLVPLCLTPFSVLEALGTRVPSITVTSQVTRGLAPDKVVLDVVMRSKVFLEATQKLAQPNLLARAEERLSYLPPRGHNLFKHCVVSLCQRPEITTEIITMLAWDHALKMAYPKAKREEFDRFFALVLMTMTAAPMISRFRIVKRMWDSFYRNKNIHRQNQKEEIEDANHAMRLKSTRDFLDCDLLHLVCFGWGERDVTAITCDPPESVSRRIGVYRGVTDMVRSWGGSLGKDNLPPFRNGRVICCNPDLTAKEIIDAECVAPIGR